MNEQLDLEKQRPPIPIPPGDDDLCRALWLSVLVQAVVDAKSQRSRSCFKRYQDRALDWINGSTGDEDRDFIEVCNLAGVDSKEMRRLISEALESESDNFNFRCLMKQPRHLLKGNPGYRPRVYSKSSNKQGSDHIPRARDLSIGTIRNQKPETIH